MNNVTGYGQSTRAQEIVCETFVKINIIVFLK